MHTHTGTLTHLHACIHTHTCVVHKNIYARNIRCACMAKQELPAAKSVASLLCMQAVDCLV